jgi:GH18 family chitinase
MLAAVTLWCGGCGGGGDRLDGGDTAAEDAAGEDATTEDGAVEDGAVEDGAVEDGSGPPPGFWVTAYYPTWAISQIRPDEMDFRCLTHVIHFAGGPSMTDPYFVPGDLETDGQQPLLIDAAHAHGVRVLMSVGGIWGTGADTMDFIAADETRVRTFVGEALDYARGRGYDGIEIDWEPPANEPDMTRLVRLFREGPNGNDGLDDWTTLAPRGDLALAVANGAFEYYNIAATADLVDQFNIMMYDMDYVASGWCYDCEQDVVGFNAPLHRPGPEYPGLHQYSHNYDGTATTYDTHEYALVDGPLKWIELGMPASKIAPGIPFYTRFYIGNDAPDQPRTDFSKFGSYAEALRALTIGGVGHWYDTSMVPWIGGVATAEQASWFYHIYPGDRFYVTYDDETSVAAKAYWTIEHGLGGLMLYELSGGWLADQPEGEQDPLLRSACDALGGPDRTPPRIRVWHAPAIADSTQAVTFHVEAADASRVASISIFIDGAAAPATTCTATPSCSFTGGPYTASSAHEYYATATDAAPTPNTGTSDTATLTVIAEDNQPPAVSFTAPAEGATVANETTVTVDAHDAEALVDRVELYVAGTLAGTLAAAPYDFALNTWAYPNGTLALEARAYDLKGNQGTATRSVQVDNAPAPDVWIYRDAFESGWSDWSWGGSADPANASPVHGGSASIAFTPSAAWGAFSTGSSTEYWGAAYSGIEFYLHGGDTPEEINFGLEGGGRYGAVPNVTTTSSWQRVFLDLRVLDASGDPFTRIDMQSAGLGGNVFYIDDVRLVGGGG